MKESKLKNTLHDCVRNRNLMIGLVILLSIIVIAIFADSIAPFPYNKNSVGGRLEAPSAEHWFGTRDRRYADHLMDLLPRCGPSACDRCSGRSDQWLFRKMGRPCLFFYDRSYLVYSRYNSCSDSCNFTWQGTDQLDHRDLACQLGILCTSGSLSWKPEFPSVNHPFRSSRATFFRMFCRL